MRKTGLKALAFALVLTLVSCMFTTNLAFGAGTDNATDSQSFRPQNIVGKDDRVTVSDTYEYPFSAIAFMRVYSSCECGGWEGSGFMVLPDIMLTAAHCVYCPKHQQPADRIELYFGYKPDGSYAYAYTGPTRFECGTSFSGGYTKENMERDWAVVRLDEFVGYQTGYFGMRVLSDSEFNGAVLRVAGYRDGMLKYDTNKMEVASKTTIKHYADAVSGNSGCPIYDGTTASAIDIASNDAGYNVGYRITDDVFNKTFEMTKSGLRPDPPSGGDLVVKPDDTGSNGYVLPYAATHRYTRSELSSLTKWELYIARNEIAARHGYIFGKADLKSYFGGKTWYKGTLTDTEFKKIIGILNDTEEANVDTILAMENAMGSDLVPGGRTEMRDSGTGSAVVNDPGTTGPSDYVLPQSDTHRYTEAELSPLSSWGLYIARNEIPARHGYIFKNADLSSYFGGKTWYRGTLTGDEFRSIVGILNSTEEANVDTILALEKKRNSPYVPEE